MTDPFMGHEPRECGDHRTTGQRAWCFDDSEWCYPDLPCRGCELPALRAAAGAVASAEVPVALTHEEAFVLLGAATLCAHEHRDVAAEEAFQLAVGALATAIAIFENGER